MKKLLLIISLVFVCSISGFADNPAPGCTAIYELSTFFHYPYRQQTYPPFWQLNRWECVPDLYIPPSPAFPNSPANGTDTQFPLGVWHEPFRIFNPIRYVNEDILHMYTLTSGPLVEIDPSAYSVNQGTGVVTLNAPPASGTHLHFEIYPK